jgi:ATP-dependent Clp protease ATP-binding subunit ClpX
MRMVRLLWPHADQHTRTCSFCGKGEAQVQRLIAGPGIFICNACVQVCNEILQQG